jgi:hypothetical protein
MENGGVRYEPVSTGSILRIMQKNEFLSKLAVAMALDWLVHREFLRPAEAYLWNEEGGYMTHAYEITENGRSWLRDNESTLNLLNEPPF